MAREWLFRPSDFEYDDHQEATDTYNKSHQLVTSIGNVLKYTGDAEERLHLVCCDQYSKRIEKIAILKKKVAYSLPVGISFPQLEALELTVDLSSLGFRSGFLVVLQTIKTLASASTQDKFQLSIAFNAVSKSNIKDSASKSNIQDIDWKHQAGYAILVSDIVDALARKNKLHFKFAFKGEVQSPENGPALLVSSSIALLLQRQHADDKLELCQPPNYYLNMLQQSLSAHGTKIMCRVTFESPALTILQTLAQLPPRVRFTDLTLLFSSPPNKKPTALALADHLVAALARAAARSFLDIRAAGDDSISDIPLSKVKQVQLHGLRFTGNVDVAHSACPMLACLEFTNHSAFACIHVLELVQTGASKFLRVLAELKLEALHNLSLFPVEDHEALWDYKQLVKSFPNLVEYLYKISDASDHCGYGFYQHIGPFQIGHYAWSHVCRRAVGGFALALELSGLDVPEDLVCFRLLPYVADAQRRHQYSDVDEEVADEEDDSDTGDENDDGDDDVDE
eukprot:TRINITY_DN17384_c0_g1_i1.p2 TRINITY_DN17384_c0_g1~~TRINITY_DN17384_c0_g1_i1.p2  ORF type:complete len:510 (+),score=75.33 TRINITY_DN17384_c0_g1_i1:1843-3372(+)